MFEKVGRHGLLAVFPPDGKGVGDSSPVERAYRLRHAGVSARVVGSSDHPWLKVWGQRCGLRRAAE
jgi:hypothetical protein